MSSSTSSTPRPIAAAGALKAFVSACLTTVGVTEQDAAVVADVLVAADLRGVESHGVARLRRYVDGIRQGKIRAERSLSIVRENAATAVLDAGNGLGQPASVAAMELAIAKAGQVGLGAVAVRRSNHFGIAGYYAMLALEHGMVGIATTNASPQVTPTFGAEPMFGTNPIAVALPAGGPFPFVLDMATSVVPRGKLERLGREGEAIPEGWAIDAEGRPMTELGELVAGLKGRRGFSLLPLGGGGEIFSGHKGFGLGLLVDLLCGPLAGASWGRHVYGPEGADLGHWFAALRVDCFADPEELAAETAALLAEVRSARKIPGESRIYIPGEKEAIETERRLRDGIPLNPLVYEELGRIASEVGLPFALA
jgi:LDH2 family malate/lactate/ureidoglycolate dehydrogenase